MAAPVPNYAHNATWLSPHDADSFWLTVDFGMNTHGVRLTLPLYIRLFGIDGWELSQPLGPDARDFTTQVLSKAKRIVVATLKPDGIHQVGEEKYGRWLARVWADDQELADLLRTNGFEKTVPTAG